MVETAMSLRRHKPSPAVILAVVAFGVFVAADDLTVVSTMFRQIIYDLGIPVPSGLNDAAWIVNAYLIAYVVVMPFIGRVSDIFGRRPVYIASLTLFLAGSIWVPLAPDLGPFIAARVLTALGGGAMVPVGMAIIGDIYPRQRRARALGVLGAVDTAGWVWGPLYGALLIRFLSWRWQFYLNIPLSLLGIAAAWWALGHLPEIRRKAQIDWLGTSLLTASLLLLNIALLNSGELQSGTSLVDLSGQQQTNVAPLYLLAALFFGLFVVVERRLARGSWPQLRLRRRGTPDTVAAPDPLIDPGLLRRRNFAPAVTVNFLVGAALIIAMINVPLLINIIEPNSDQAALRSGWLLGAMTASMAIMAYVGGRMTERFSYRATTALGLLLCGIGFTLMGTSWAADTPSSRMAWQLAIVGAGFGLVTAPIGAAVINAAPEDQRGIASSLVIVLRLIGMSVGLSGLTAWSIHRFDILRQQIELPPLADPGFQEALMNGLTLTTVVVLTETFIAAGLIVLASLGPTFFLRQDASRSEVEEETAAVRIPD